MTDCPGEMDVVLIPMSYSVLVYCVAFSKDFSISFITINIHQLTDTINIHQLNRCNEYSSTYRYNEYSSTYRCNEYSSTYRYNEYNKY